MCSAQFIQFCLKPGVWQFTNLPLEVVNSRVLIACRDVGRQARGHHMPYPDMDIVHTEIHKLCAVWIHQLPDSPTVGGQAGFTNFPFEVVNAKGPPPAGKTASPSFTYILASTAVSLA
jgi:hypothetical protein